MDIEARLRSLSESPSASSEEFDAFYADAVNALGSVDSEKLDGYIRQLKSLCLDRAIDHSRYAYRSTPAAAKTPGAVHPTPLDVSGPESPVASVDVKQMIHSCRERAPFLSFGALRVVVGGGQVPEKLAVLYSQCINDDWVHKIFHPDLTCPISEFKLTSLTSNVSWVILCLFHASDRGVVEIIERLLEDNPEILILDLADLEGQEDHFWKKDRQRLYNGTVPNKPSLLVNDLLDAEQECLIKDFFGSNAGFLICSDLKGGFSGARVILVAPNIGPGDPRKYVVKVCEKSRSKLRDEFERFQNLVAPFWVPDQFMAAEFKESPRYQAIRYPFASKDTIRDSKSFTVRYRHGDAIGVLQAVVGNIFDHSLSRKWREQARARKKKFSVAFAPVLDPVESAASLDQLLSPTFSSEATINREQLIKILDSEAEFLECPNHGDLHSDNIQIQDESNDVFLIDFGLAGTYPAGLDYAALEASIRFRLLDYSIDHRILHPLDSDPLSKFDSLVRPGEPSTGEVDRAQKLCSVIRERFLNDFSDKKGLAELKFQYLCCLLALCLRQINYSDMNRRYILQLMSQVIPPIYASLAAISPAAEPPMHKSKVSEEAAR